MTKNENLFSKEMLAPKKIWVMKNSGSKRNFWSKNFWSNKNWPKKLCIKKKSSGPKIFGSEHKTS